MGSYWVVVLNEINLHEIAERNGSNILKWGSLEIYFVPVSDDFEWLTSLVWVEPRP